MAMNAVLATAIFPAITCGKSAFICNCPYLANYLAFCRISGHIWPMLKTPLEIQHSVAMRLKARRVALGWTQRDAAHRAGIAYRTWRRLENEGKASFEDVIRSAIALRCEGGLEALFPQPVATSLDDLLKHQAANAAPPVRVRARTSRQS